MCAKAADGVLAQHLGDRRKNRHREGLGITLGRIDQTGQSASRGGLHQALHHALILRFQGASGDREVRGDELLDPYDGVTLVGQFAGTATQVVELSQHEKKQRVLGVERRELDRFRNDVAEGQALVEAESKTHKLHGLFEIATVRRDDSKGRALMVEAGIQALLRDQLVQRLLMFTMPRR